MDIGNSKNFLGIENPILYPKDSYNRLALVNTTTSIIIVYAA